MVLFSIKGRAVAAVVLAVLQLQTAVFAAGPSGFDYFVLALQWPGNSCRNLDYCCYDNACCPLAGRGLPPNRFTIHGLWPEYEGGKWPSCCSDERFDPNEISVLSKVLPEVWPTYRCEPETTCNDKKTLSFWAAQYEKHGTCAAPIIEGQYNYFSKAISLYNEYNVTRALEDLGIVPSNFIRYPMIYVLNAIRTAFNGMPKIKCAEDGIIKEVWLCFDKDFKPRDCDISDSCPPFVKLLPTDMPWKRDRAISRIAKVTEASI